jgi:predicted nucleic acid-binding protein
MNTLKVYLDNCCYNRPYDDQKQLRIELETKAKLHIQMLIIEKKIVLVTSVVISYENSKNPYSTRKEVIKEFLLNAGEIITNSDEVENIAEELERLNIKPKDAAHLASAISAKCDYFITTDDRLLKYKDKRIQIINPIEFIMIQGG